MTSLKNLSNKKCSVDYKAELVFVLEMDQKLQNLLLKVKMTRFFKFCNYCIQKDFPLILFIFSQKLIQFCIPEFETLQPILPQPQAISNEKRQHRVKKSQFETTQFMDGTFGFWPYRFRPGPCYRQNDHAKPEVEHYQLAPTNAKK